jgi:hypothetical protein
MQSLERSASFESLFFIDLLAPRSGAVGNGVYLGFWRLPSLGMTIECACLCGKELLVVWENRSTFVEADKKPVIASVTLSIFRLCFLFVSDRNPAVPTTDFALRKEEYDSRSETDVWDHPHHRTNHPVRRTFSADLADDKGSGYMENPCDRISSAQGMPMRA